MEANTFIVTYQYEDMEREAEKEFPKDQKVDAWNFYNHVVASDFGWANLCAFDINGQEILDAVNEL